ncbi:hypothetical protein [Microbacterium sp. CFBP9034]|uniref:hypothetical protein n=1 Tax=Microbacterium sp. CFBP9034 TaxID=3096540 RepID=UPI002A6AFCFE|nr:hypothetical protein [Microbacterium sp. CFBP9034]MDY0908841.1 hypothetical protein [Microbacterium sp. CFBP9034]
MKVHTLHVDGQQFVLEPGQDVDGLRDEILDAARSGAGFVRFHAVGRAIITVLITSHVGVRLEVMERDPQEIELWQDHPPSIDQFASFEDLI